MKVFLPFRKLPEGLGLFRSARYCVLDISGIQKYIFMNMDRSSTLGQLHSRSRYVQALSQVLLERVQKAYGNKVLFSTVSSGKVRFGLSPRVKEEELRALLDRLQRQVFASTGGKLTFFYATVPVTCVEESKFSDSRMVYGADALAAQLAVEKNRCKNLLETDMVQDVDPELRAQPTEDPAPIPQGDLAVVKLDLDNLGNFFKKRSAFDTGAQVSQRLDQIIHRTLEKDKRIIPVFAGGDDIFFLCPMAQYLSVVGKFHHDLHRELSSDPFLCDYGNNHFGLSCGVSLIRGNFCPPVLTFWEQSEEALHIAKCRGGKNCLCLLLPDGQPRILDWPGLYTLAALYETQADQICANKAIPCEQLADPMWLIGRLTPRNKKELTELARIKNAML